MPCLSIAPSKGRKNRKAVVFLRDVQAESPGEITALSDRYGRRQYFLAWIIRQNTGNCGLAVVIR